MCVFDGGAVKVMYDKEDNRKNPDKQLVNKGGI